MKIATISLAVAVVAAGAVASLAAGSGEPKSQAPFARLISIGARYHGRTLVTASPGPPMIRPEPKNERPFTRPANDDPGLAVALREIARNEIPPFTRRVSEPEGRSFFSNGAGIGALAGLGLCATALICGLMTLMRRSPA